MLVNEKVAHAVYSMHHCGMRMVWDRCRRLCCSDHCQMV